ncbi:phosphoribosylformimino-5-aminoimidazole carboxamide ribotide isomerase [Methanolinea mesophila]|uniref:HisA/HisF-related TIM barrel protein n=1 Tax=Methanolinea mesophila TaxID=547055 RepID=UPI001FD7D2B1|nr:HisA/HisF-related TIM barrel protein [Methanolinea mesophila]MBP1929688.1 phosphoribosylformimino-5-aminoimidazole carboxamide ribotide isomerase [Methanolinea mesophila]
MDLLGGLVVQGKSGNRSSYTPLTWGLAPSADPPRYLEFMRPKYLYIADLDSIEGRIFDAALIRSCVSGVERCYLDRGVRSTRDLVDIQNVINVVGTETAGADLAVYRDHFLSIDIRNSNVIPGGGDPGDLLRNAADQGFRGCILLMISSVGTGTGVEDRNMLDHYRSLFPGTLLYGGGVRAPQDLQRLKDAGFDGAIVATAVHKGAIPLEWLRRGHPC